jgi:hypothetical protein
VRIALSRPQRLVGASSLRMFEVSDGEPYPLNPAVAQRNLEIET